MNFLKDDYHRSILGWFLLSFLVAWWMPITADEALYYVYGKNLAWGFHDHPPMVAVFTALGNIAASTLLVRFLGILALTVAFAIGDKIIKERAQNRTLFHFGWWMIPILHVYGIVITPDVPLLFFTMLLWWCLHRWMTTEKLPMLFILVLAGLMYSKYHAAIVIALALFPMRRFWRVKPLVASFVAFLLFLPHLFWQYNNDWDTFRYHFVDRKGDFEWQHLGGFVAAQIGLFHPYLWYLVFRERFYQKQSDEWLRLHQRVFFGLVIFFTIMVMRGRAEAHWAAAGSFSLLFLLSTIQVESVVSTLRKVSVVTIVILLIGRIPLMVDSPLNLDFFKERRYMAAVENLAGDAPVAFMNSYAKPSAYMFYTGKSSHSINNISGGLSQYQVWHYDTALVDNEFLWISNFEGSSAFSAVQTGEFELQTAWMSDYQTLEKLWFEFESEKMLLQPGTNRLETKLINKSIRSIDLGKVENLRVKMFVNYKKQGQMTLPVECDSLPSFLDPGASVPMEIKVDIPEDVAGEYWFKISLNTEDVPGYINSNRCFFEVID